MPQIARYSVEHVTHYDYPQPVSVSQQLVHLEPQKMPWQKVESWQLDCEPAANFHCREVDAFENPVARLEFNSPHDSLTITTRMQVCVSERAPRSLKSRPAPSWERARDSLRYRAGYKPGVAELDACRYRFRSPFVPIGTAYQRYAKDCFVPGRPLVDAARALMEKIHQEFEFDADATQVGTPLADVLHEKRGVCQDFAHLMLACLRSLDLPCRYVSGYLLTHPPAGKPRLVGADASHAWVAVRCPMLGWMEFDPTNNVQPGLEHIVIGWGRDFADVSPLRGVILGAASVPPEVSVTVTPLAHNDAQSQSQSQSQSPIHAKK